MAVQRLHCAASVIESSGNELSQAAQKLKVSAVLSTNSAKETEKTMGEIAKKVAGTTGVFTDLDTELVCLCDAWLLPMA